jgi:hypothetical protein
VYYSRAPQCTVHKLRDKEAGDLRVEVINNPVVSHDEQSCVSHLPLMDSEACHVCGSDELSLQRSKLL